MSVSLLSSRKTERPVPNREEPDIFFWNKPWANISSSPPQLPASLIPKQAAIRFRAPRTQTSDQVKPSVFACWKYCQIEFYSTPSLPYCLASLWNPWFECLMSLCRLRILSAYSEQNVSRRSRKGVGRTKTQRSSWDSSRAECRGWLKDPCLKLCWVRD